ncbi:MAG TPA: SDR family NAD(P)-dependent oxidoreductase [Hyphomicrobiaceae bacterium]|nr:SDR family NAD(P)-dependent oxidoreductase [Hyphomicrobiaceae bacterium]
MTDHPLDGRVALVTGASRGIGKAVAKALAGAGAHVVLVARTVGGLEETDDEIRALGGQATLVKLDLRNGEQLDALGPSLYQRWQRLDILVANAGILGPLTPVPHVKTKDWAEVIEINLSANFRLIRTLDPLLRASDAGRAIFVSSGAALARNAYWGPYAVSKSGLEALVKTYAQEMLATSVKANIVNPGPIRTGMRAKAFPGEDPETLKTADDLAPLFLRLASPTCADTGRIFDFKTGDVR